MKRFFTLAAVAGLALLATTLICVADDGEPHQALTLLYASAAQWQHADRPTRIAFAREFMRIYCGDPAMLPEQLVDCMDDHPREVFATALACSVRSR
jgi:hypothetical protein